MPAFHTHYTTIPDNYHFILFLEQTIPDFCEFLTSNIKSLLDYESNVWITPNWITFTYSVCIYFRRPEQSLSKNIIFSIREIQCLF